MKNFECFQKLDSNDKDLNGLGLKSELKDSLEEKKVRSISKTKTFEQLKVKFNLTKEKIKTEMEKIKPVQYKEIDLLYSVEKNNFARIIAHLKSGTDINCQTNVHRNLSKSYSALEYAVNKSNYDAVNLFMENGGKITPELESLVDKDPILSKSINDYKILSNSSEG